MTDRHRKPWTDAENKELDEIYLKHSIKWLAAHFGRTQDAIKNYAHRRGLRRRRGRWTFAEDEIIIDKSHLSAAKLMELLPGRTWGAIRARRCFRGIRAVAWSEADKVYLLKHYEELGMVQVAEELGRTPEAAKAKYRRLLDKSVNLC